MSRSLNRSYHDQLRARKQRRRQWRLLAWLMLLVVIGLSGVYLFWWSELFTVRQVTINSQGTIVTHQEIDQVASQYLAEKRWGLARFKNIFLVDKTVFTAKLSQALPALKNIRVSKDYFHGLNLSFEERQAIGVWCFTVSNQCYYFSSDGVAFDVATASSGSLLLNVESPAVKPVALGDRVTDDRLLGQITALPPALAKLGLSIAKITTPADNSFKLTIETGEAWELYLATDQSLEKQLATLEVFLTSDGSNEQRKNWQYLDARLPNRIYYK